ncbi:ADP-ribosylglycohydrolase family protein [uncultured Dokdonia sp.]|uniref:ADP-ribosylglycohydrolase family protein n=1 Tax=uncultured Dokdonia sp. TaxID=575653 RepID=UPI00261A69D5|nr:ADP-ribosylglycohydrolase family protein [uncultured Dokdonia sp.]
MILEGAIGDAYGAGFEFANKHKIDCFNSLTTYETHELFPEIKGRYTDDTQMSIALAELIISGDDWTPINIANAFVNTFKRDSRRGYAKRFYSFLSEVKNGQEFLNKIINKSDRNGAAMRAYVIGVFTDESEVIEKCSIQADCTHGTKSAIVSANAIALISHYFIYGKGKKDTIIEYINDLQKGEWTGKWTGEVDMSGISTVEAVLSLLKTDMSLKERLKASVAFGGDVDTVASLVLAISSLDNTIENDLPFFLMNDLENGTYGKDFLKDLDKSLKKI